jgi:hypothetical protein
MPRKSGEKPGMGEWRNLEEEDFSAGDVRSGQDEDAVRYWTPTFALAVPRPTSVLSFYNILIEESPLNYYYIRKHVSI